MPQTTDEEKGTKVQILCLSLFFKKQAMLNPEQVQTFVAPDLDFSYGQ